MHNYYDPTFTYNQNDDIDGERAESYVQFCIIIAFVQASLEELIKCFGPSYR